MRKPPTTKRKPAEQILPRVKVWIEIDGTYVLGRGISEILRAVDRVGSIKQAAQELGKSYRYVWNRIKEAERALGVSLVEAQVGGKDTHRSHLSELGRTLMVEFDGWRDRVAKLLENEFPDRLQWLLQHRG